MLKPAKYIVKRGLQQVAARFGRHTVRTGRPQLLILMYHRILPAQDERARIEEPGMMVTPGTFRLHMRLVRQHFDVLPLSRWIEAKHSGEKLPARSCCITFDDGWEDNYEFAFPILKELALPATIFLVSDMIGTSQLFWPERLARIFQAIAASNPEHWKHGCLDWLDREVLSYDFSSTPPAKEQLSAIIQQAKKFTDDEIHTLADRIENELHLDIPRRPSLLDWQQVNEMQNSGLIDIGSHTCHHIRLNEGLDPATLKAEIAGSKIQLEKQLERPVHTFCYPNGDVSPQAMSMVKQHYHCAVTTQSGWNTQSDDEYQLRRIGVHEDISADKTAFLARLSGWM